MFAKTIRGVVEDTLYSVAYSDRDEQTDNAVWIAGVGPAFSSKDRKISIPILVAKRPFQAPIVGFTLEMSLAG